MDNHYYIRQKGIQKGPFKIDELRLQNIFEDDLVWKSGTPSWFNSSLIPEISNFIIHRPAKTNEERIEERVKKDNKIIWNEVKEKTISLYVVFSFFISLISFTKISNCISKIHESNLIINELHITNGDFLFRPFNSLVSGCQL